MNYRYSTFWMMCYKKANGDTSYLMIDTKISPEQVNGNINDSVRLPLSSARCSGAAACGEKKCACVVTNLQQYLALLSVMILKPHTYCCVILIDLK